KPRSALRILAIMSLCGLAVGGAAQVTGSQSLDFDNVDLGGIPSGWHLNTTGYTAQVVPVGVVPGKRSVELRLSDPATPSTAGNLMQTLDATPYRGKQVRFRAAVRVQGAAAADRAQLWLRVDRQSGQAGFLDNMADRPVRDMVWRYV